MVLIAVCSLSNGAHSQRDRAAGGGTSGVDVALVEGFPVGRLDVLPCQPPQPQARVGHTLALLHRTIVTSLPAEQCSLITLTLVIIYTLVVRVSQAAVAESPCNTFLPQT